MDTAQFPPGEMLDDKYRIDALLSVGGMGAVYIGTHTLLRKRVAIKVLRTELVNAMGMVERFQREAVAASAIGHENIVTVTDMGKTQGGVAFLVMELLEGRSLAQAIKDDGPLPLAISCDVACEILSGVAAAHRVGIVHRDLKPENVFLARRGSGRGEAVKILDFGISSLGSEKPELRLTLTGVVMGTPNYMAPEQARGDKEITAAADIYSTAVILYEMITKQVPYEAENYNLLMFRVLSGEYIKPSIRRPDIPPGLEAVILRAMALNPWDRFKSAEEFAEALKPFCSGGTGVALVVPQTGAHRRASGNVATSDTLAASASEVLAGSRVGQAAHPRRRAAWKVAVPLVGAAAVAAVVALVITHGNNTKGSNAPAPSAAIQPPAQPTKPAAQPAQQQPAQPGQQAPAPQPVQQAPMQQAPVQPAQPEPVVIEIATTPKDARIFLDGKPATLDAGKLTLAPSNDAIAIRVEADGYEPYQGKITPDRSKAIELPPLARKKSHGHGGGHKDGKIVTDDPYGGN